MRPGSCNYQINARTSPPTFAFLASLSLERVLPAEMEIKQEGEEILVSRPNDLKKMKSLHGLTRTLVYNMVTGVTEGFSKELEVT